MYAIINITFSNVMFTNIDYIGSKSDQNLLIPKQVVNFF